MSNSDYISLKWGTLKAWNLRSEAALTLLRRYVDLGVSGSAALQKDTQEQKDLICQIIDVCNAPTIHLDWEGKNVTKEEAKMYVMDYGN